MRWVADTGTLRIPKVFHYGPLPAPGGGRGRGSFIVMEFLHFGGRSSAAELGRQLALMHLAAPSVGARRSCQGQAILCPVWYRGYWMVGQGRTP